jgi:DNA-binding response OmpR family regulator
MPKKDTKSAGKKVLIVEDERPLSHALELKFTHEGYEVVIATDGAEALKIANTTKFEVILLDLIMPNMDGFTFMEKLKKKSPIIILSNLGQDEDKERAKELGAIGYFVKSNTPITEIIKAVKSNTK